MPAKIVAPRKKQAGDVRTQAMRMFRSVLFCKPDWLANMVPAIPEVRTCVVLTGRPKLSARKMAPIVVSSAAAPCAYAK